MWGLGKGTLDKTARFLLPIPSDKMAVILSDGMDSTNMGCIGNICGIHIYIYIYIYSYSYTECASMSPIVKWAPIDRMAKWASINRMVKQNSINRMVKWAST